jgi:hypothetical protein
MQPRYRYCLLAASGCQEYALKVDKKYRLGMHRISGRPEIRPDNPAFLDTGIRSYNALHCRISGRISSKARKKIAQKLIYLLQHVLFDANNYRYNF